MQNAFTDDGKVAPTSKISGSTDFDMAGVLYQMFKGEFVCCSIQSNIWYKYNKHCWKKSDNGTELRKSISMEMRELYLKKMQDTMTTAAAMEEGTEQRKRMEARGNKIAEITARLGKTQEKNNIMREARELFYDGEFMNKLDTNPYLLCFRNGVVDFERKLFRKGYPDDYVSKSTQIDYIPHDPVKHKDQIAEIHDFMQKLFPVAELREYMWQHLASGMIGTAINQTLTFYLGVGSNGKSVLVEFMSKVLGDYKYDAPISLIASQRPKIGGLSPEVVALKGVRYSVIAEPEKNERIQEGAMKQMVSGLDPIQCRAPYMIEPIVFLPQFSLALCCNTLPEIASQDHLASYSYL
jgi:phage/plasmid-associated DNA primase